MKKERKLWKRLKNKISHTVTLNLRVMRMFHRPQRKIIKARGLRRSFTKLLMAITRDYSEPGIVLRIFYIGLQYNCINQTTTSKE